MKDKLKQVNELAASYGSYINQHGKKCISVWSQVKAFREVFGTDFGIHCQILEHSDRYVIVQAKIFGYDPERIISSGISKQYRDILEDITSKEEYEELDIPVQPMNGKDTTSNNINYDDSIINELVKKVHYAPHTAKLDFLWRANRELLDQIKIKDLATYNSILNKFNSKRDEITTQNEV